MWHAQHQHNQSYYPPSELTAAEVKGGVGGAMGGQDELVVEVGSNLSALERGVA